MKKTLFAMAALATFGVASSANAQSSVTLYGVLDQSVGYTSASGLENKKLFNLPNSGGLQGSRWGLKGSEDLGGGMSAFFVLESGFNVANGKLTNNNTLFNRQALVGLRSREAGAVSFGRQSDFVVDNVAQFSPVARYARSLGGAIYDLNNFDYTSQMQNSVKYVSPLFSGFQFGGAVSLGGVAGKTGQDLTWSAGASYENGPIKLGAGYVQSRGDKYAPVNAAGTFAPLVAEQGSTASIFKTATAKRDTYQIAAVGGSYTVGPANIAASYSYINSNASNANASLGATGYADVSEITGTAARKSISQVIDVNGTYQVAPALLVGLGYSYTKSRHNGNFSGAGTGPQADVVFSQPVTRSLDGKESFHQVTLGGVYSLSRRTEVYVVGAVQRNGSKNGNFTQINGNDSSSKRHQLSARVGLRHAF